MISWWDVNCTITAMICVSLLIGTWIVYKIAKLESKNG